MYDPHATIKTSDGAVLERLSSLNLLPDSMKIELEDFLADNYEAQLAETLNQFRLMVYKDLQDFEDWQCRMAEEDAENVACGLALPPSSAVFPSYPPHVV